MIEKRLTLALSAWLLIALILLGATSQFTYLTDGTPGSRGILLLGVTILHNEQPVWRNAWLPVLLMLCIVCVAAVSAKLIESHCRDLVSPVAFVACSAAVAILIGVAVSAGWSRRYWGYWWSRPHSNASWWGVQQVSSFAAIRCEGIGKTRRCTTAKAGSLAGLKNGCASDPYYCLGERLPVALATGGVLLVDREPTSEALRRIEQFLSAPGLLARSEPAYSGNRLLSGLVVTGVSASPREELVALAVSGGQLSNDHYPMYEFVFRLDGASLQPLRRRTFFYDVAGIEGAELPWVAVAVAMLAIVVAVPVSLSVALIVATKRMRGRIAA